MQTKADKHGPKEIPQNKFCCCEQPIHKQQNIFIVMSLDAHNNNIGSVGFPVDCADKSEAQKPTQAMLANHHC